MTDGPSIVFKGKAVVDQTYIRNSENIRNHIMGIVTLSLFNVSAKSRQVFTHGGSSTQILKNSQLEPINFVDLRTWSGLISNHNVRNVSLKAIIQPGNNKRLTVLAWIDFVLIATPYSKTWFVVSIFAHVKKIEQASWRRKCREESKKENMMN